MLDEKLLENLKEAIYYTETEYGEPQMWVYLKSGRSIEITFESYCIAKDNQFFSIRLHCSDNEFNDGLYEGTNGIIELEATDSDSHGFEKIKEDALKEALKIIKAYHEEISRKEDK